MLTRLLRVCASGGFATVILFLTLSLFHPPTDAAGAASLCVQPGNVGCYGSIGAALIAAQDGDTIRVAAGTYIENVVITESVMLEGGWNASFTARDPVAYVTVIRPADPLMAVVTIGALATITPTLDGFTITGGRSDNHGGGLRLRDSNALIRNNVITDNVGFLLGGGVWVQRGAPRFENNRIENNRSDGLGQFAQGGGIQLEGTQARLMGNVIAGNVVSGTTGNGGGIDIGGGGPVTLIGNTIVSNSVASAGSGYGGGVSASAVTLTLSNNVIQSNTANSVARGFGGGVYVFSSGAFTLTGNTVMSNTAGFAPGSGPYLLGGGMLVDSSRGLLSGNILVGNRANRNTIFGDGGGLAIFTSTLSVQGGEIANNSVSRNCEGYGGGLYAYNSSITLDATRLQQNCAANTPFYGLGGGLAFVNSPYTLTNALIAQNYSFGNDTAVGGLFAGVNSPGLLVNNTLANNNGQGIRAASPLTLINNIIMGHTTGVSLTAAVPVSVTYNDFYANTTPQRGFSLDFSNIVINPQLDANHHLTPASPLRDAGARVSLPTHDIDGEGRPAIGPSGLYRYDIGADEAPGPAQRIVDLDAAPADLTIIGPGNPNDTSNGSNDWIGYAVLGDDVDGDGRADLVVTAEDWAEDFDTLNATGRLFGLRNFGARITGTIDLLTDTASITVVSQYIRQHLGSELAGGELNGDGRRDLIAGSFENDNDDTVPITPTVFVLFGGASLSGTRTLTDATPTEFMLRAPDQDFFAFSRKNALTADDLNGDGVGDVIVGDALADESAAITDTGAVFVVFGKSGLSGLHDLRGTPANYTLFGPAPLAGLDAGLGAVAVGRVNAGPQVDLVARTDITAYVVFGPLGSGALRLRSTTANITITGLQAGAVGVADLTGDGQDDVILGSGSNLHLIPGPLSAGQTFDVASRSILTLTGAAAEALAAGDVAGDMRPDLIVGARSIKHVFAVQAGLGVTGSVPIAEAAATIVKSVSLKNLGWDVAAGDLDLDGRPDLIASTWQQDVESHPDKYKDAGMVFVLYSATHPRIYLPLVIKAP